MDIHDLLYILVSFILSSLVLLWIGWYVYRQIEYKFLKFPPGPCGYPILGCALSIQSDAHKSCAELNRKYGKICSTTVLMKRIIFVDDYDTAKGLLGHQAVLSRPPNFFKIAPENAGFAGMNGALWDRERKFMMQAIKNVGFGRDLWQDVLHKMVEDAVIIIANQKGQPFNIARTLSDCAVRSFCAIVFSQKYLDSSVGQEVQILERAYRVFQDHFKFSNPSALWPGMLKYFIVFDINGYRQKDRIWKKSVEIFRKEILKRINTDEYDPSADIISYYLQHNLSDDSSEDAKNQAVNLLIGHLSIFLSTSDTGTKPSEWILLLMAAYPKIQNKVHQEIDKAIGRTEKISWNDRRKFPYCLACVKEMIRWCSVLPFFIPRWTTEEFEFQGYTVPKNAVVLVNSWAMHRNHKYWNNPSEYIPERFLNCEENELIKVDGFGPFSFGKRKCPGENIAMISLFLFFTGIMQKFSVKSVTDESPDLSQHFSTTIEPMSQTLCYFER